MGLAASQARLLTITSRKSSAQFESMRLSHEKLALSRSLTDVSNEYQNSLKQTKLFYDFYGIGSTDNMLSYGLFMTPSYINDYTPVLITNRQNRIVLSSSFAAAARAAGIPQEGLDGFIDDTTRDRFIGTLTSFGEIDPMTSAYIQQTDYNPHVGLGQTTGIYTSTQTESYDAFERQLGRVKLKDYNGCSAADLANALVVGDKSQITAYTVVNTSTHNNGNGTGLKDAFSIPDSNFLRLSDTHGQNFRDDGTASFSTGGTWDNLTLYDILYGDDVILTQNVQVDAEVTNPLNPHQYDDMLNVINNVIGVLADQLEDTYGADDAVRLAIAQANANMNAACWGNNDATELAVYTPGEGQANPWGLNPGYLIHSDGTVSASWPWLQFNPDMPDFSSGNPNVNTSNLNLLALPNYSTTGDPNDDMWYATAEDIYNGSGYYSYEYTYHSVGYEPYSYWVSMPGTVEYEHHHIGANAEYSSNIDLAARNAVVYGLMGARNNLALINMYDNTANENTEGYDRGNYGAINLSKFVQAWFTYFMQALANNKINTATGDEYTTLNNLLNGPNALNVNFHQRNGNSHFATFNEVWNGSAMVHQEVNLSAITLERGEILVDDGIASIASFYDTIINQICEYGWCENNEVKEDPVYLQEMLKTGKMFLFKLANDSYYYQNNYATDTFIKEIADESAIAQAEAKYKTQKARINAKEQEIDIKMKNLDTEISSLETEYEAVKKMIANSQKVFQRYQ